MVHATPLSTCGRSPGYAVSPSPGGGGGVTAGGGGRRGGVCSHLEAATWPSSLRRWVALGAEPHPHTSCFSGAVAPSPPVTWDRLITHARAHTQCRPSTHPAPSQLVVSDPRPRSGGVVPPRAQRGQVTGALGSGGDGPSVWWPELCPLPVPSCCPCPQGAADHGRSLTLLMH